eukprot:161738_1
MAQQLEMQSIVRIKVSGAGLLDINGNYDICTVLSNLPHVPLIEKTALNHHRHKPEFMYVHLSTMHGSEWQYAIYLQPVPAMGYDRKQLLWVLARVNINNDTKSEPIVMYIAERRNKDRIPPPNGWRPVGGITPVPKTQLVQLDIPKKKETGGSPLRKAIEQANQDTAKMTELLFDLQPGKANKTHGMNKGHKGPKIKQVNANPRRDIIQPGAKTKDMRRVRGE